MTTNNFLQEAMILKDFQHENVMKLMCVLFQRGNPCIVYPFMINGNLLDYLKEKNKVHPNILQDHCLGSRKQAHLK